MDALRGIGIQPNTGIILIVGAILWAASTSYSIFIVMRYAKKSEGWQRFNNFIFTRTRGYGKRMDKQRRKKCHLRIVIKNLNGIRFLFCHYDCFLNSMERLWSDDFQRLDVCFNRQQFRWLVLWRLSDVVLPFRDHCCLDWSLYWKKKPLKHLSTVPKICYPLF